MLDLGLKAAATVGFTSFLRPVSAAAMADRICVCIYLLGGNDSNNMIVPLDGVQSKTKLYRVLYVILGPLLPLLRGRFPKYVTSTEQIGRAMLKVAKQGWGKQVLESADINLV